MDEKPIVPASFFDVDGTLVRTNLLHPTLFYLANQPNPLRSLGALARAALGAPRMALAEMLDRRLFNELLFASYEGISQDRLFILADEAFDTVIKRAIYPGARDLVQRCRAEGHDVVLVSGALDFLMERLAKHLGATAFHREPARNQGRLRHRQAPAPHRRRPREGAPRPRVGAGPRGRPRRLFRVLRQLLRRADALGRRPPCAVNPDFRLATLARTYAWPVIYLGKRPAMAALLGRLS